MRYPALKLVVALNYVLAALGALAIFLFARESAGSLTAAALAVAGTLAIVAVAEVLRLMMDVEESTRALRSRAAHAAPSDASAAEGDRSQRGGGWKGRVEGWFLE